MSIFKVSPSDSRTTLDDSDGCVALTSGFTDSSGVVTGVLSPGCSMTMTRRLWFDPTTCWVVGWKTTTRRSSFAILAWCWAARLLLRAVRDGRLFRSLGSLMMPMSRGPAPRCRDDERTIGLGTKPYQSNRKRNSD